ncbi:RNA polymerase, sigma subunit, ECF family [Candidatus Sulfopaludibacter sp. SbA3]|nr:RNA polymerase, sigma subunit, ECF family [Candidatus Sulfopaludibacter sp. SbA3]
MDRPTERAPITLLLQNLANGDQAALDGLIPIFYDELRKIARGSLRSERPGHTLPPTALVHELYARMIGQDHPDYRNRLHFLAVASRVMRQILIDHARTRDAIKRGGEWKKLPLVDAMDIPADSPAIVAVDEALRELEREDPGKARLVEMRFFGGLTAEESAEVLGMSVPAVRSQLRIAKAWLRRELDRAGVALPDKKSR